MSHFTVLVIGDDHEEALAPFQENNMGDCPEEYMEFEVNVAKADVAEEAKGLRERKKDDGSLYYPQYVEMSDEDVCKDYHGGDWNENGDLGYMSNPNSKWDWYSVGGRWAGFFKLKDGRTGEQGEKSWANAGEEIPENRVDQALKGDIDFEGMREEYRVSAGEKYDRLARLLGGEIKQLKYMWAEMRNKEFEHLSIDEKRKMYHDQEILQEIKKLSNSEDLSKEDRSFLSWLDYESYLCGRDEFVARAGRSAITTHAVVMNGEWYENGSMGWFGMVSDEKPEEEWSIEFEKLLNQLPDDTTLTLVDCHI